MMAEQELQLQARTQGFIENEWMWLVRRFNSEEEALKRALKEDIERRRRKKQEKREQEELEKFKRYIGSGEKIILKLD
jgi:hypothetical protein